MWIEDSNVLVCDILLDIKTFILYIIIIKCTKIILFIHLKINTSLKLMILILVRMKNK